MASSTGLGEFGLIDWIRRNQPVSQSGATALGIGDDCAILNITPGVQLLVTTDMLMDGRHFRLEADGPEAVGYKALGVNLSDIAAMAGIPRAAVVSVALPRERRVEIARGIHAGIVRMAVDYQVDLVGGDTNAWDGPLVINITLIGETTDRGPVRRAGARPGDMILVTGPLGGSLFRNRHLHPRPRIREALALASVAELHAMIDLSDGLSSDLGHILEESGGLGAILDADAVPVHDDARDQSREDGRSPIAHALDDGEDFELCLVVDRDTAVGLLECPPPPAALHCIGVVDDGQGIRLRDSDGRISSIEAGGFDHFRRETPGESP